MFEMQQKHPTKGDWASSVKELVKVYDLQLNMEEIKKTKQSVFKNLVKGKVEKFGFKTLIEKQQRGPKGRLLKYEKLELADYLLPECEVTVEERREIFSVRT